VAAPAVVSIVLGLLIVLATLFFPGQVVEDGD
jgi:hypothetical protein